MKSERWQQVERLYHAALERGAESRASFLTEVCAGDDNLRHEVESLLAYEDLAESFIESPALEVTAKLMAEEPGAAAEVGQLIEHYKIISLLGEGGMGEVYLAEDTRLERKVALKFLPPLLTQDKQHLRRFEQEARAVAALSHPNVCVIHEVFDTGDGRHCIVMEYVEGIMLRQRMAEGPMAVSEVLDVSIQVASALAASHAAGVVHRDIKPENVMLRSDGYVKVLDFGLAKLTEKKISSESTTQALELKTSPGLVMGTVAYMSPEQARGLPVDRRTDVWSLGVVLYEMLTGTKPFAGPTPTDVIISLAEREPIRLAQCMPEAPADLERILLKALAKNQERRYQTADEFLAELKSLKRELEIGAEVERYRQPTSHNSAQESVTRRFFLDKLTRGNGKILIVLTGALIATGLLAAFLFRQGLRPAPRTEIRALAVLPLENISGDASQDYFADGMTEALITDLARVNALRVMSRSSVMRYKGVQKTLAEIGRELNVDAELTGTVVRSGDKVRINLQLLHVPTNQKLWSQSYERNLQDVLTLQKQVTRDLVGELKIEVTPQELAQFGRTHSVIPEAYDQYLRGQFYLYHQTKDDNEAAIAALERAVAADPNFASAQAELAQAYVWKLFLFAPNEKEWSEKAFVAVEKALSSDPESAVAYLARGRLLWTPANHFPHEKAIREYRRALSLNPTLSEARNQLALVYCHIGAFDEALQESQLAIATDPNNNLAQFRIGQTLNFQGKYEQALSVLRAIPRESNPALVGHQIAWALFNLGKRSEAAALLEQLLKDHPEDTGGVFTSIRAVLAAAAGQERIAEDGIKTAIEKGKGFGHFHHTAYHIACAYALMNKTELAIKWLEVAAEDGFPCYPLFAKDNNLNNLRQDAQFVSFLAKLKKDWEHYSSVL